MNFRSHYNNVFMEYLKTQKRTDLFLRKYNELFDHNRTILLLVVNNFYYQGRMFCKATECLRQWLNMV